MMGFGRAFVTPATIDLCRCYEPSMVATLARLDLPRRIKPGAVLVRDWKGKSHRVTVLDKGFAFEGRTFPSLSEIAREITGTRWNGPRFFGLRPTDRPRTEELSNAAPRKRGRPPKIAHAAIDQLLRRGDLLSPSHEQKDI